MREFDWSKKIEQELASLSRLKSLVLTLAAMRENAAFREDASQLIHRMRELYFDPVHVVEFLALLSADRPVPPKMLASVRMRHGRFSHEVEEAGRALRDLADARDLHIGLDELAVLEGVIEDRSWVRDCIAGLANSLERPPLDVDAMRRDAIFLLERLAPLGKRFVEAEAKLDALVHH